MINTVSTFGLPGGCEWLVVLVVVLIIFGLPVLLVVLLIRYILQSRRENIRLRMEVGKLADELEQARKQANASKRAEASGKSG